MGIPWAVGRQARGDPPDNQVDGLDGLDLVGIAILAQTVVLAVTMVILILQFRSQEKTVKDSAYQKVLDDYNDAIRMLVARPELSALAADLVKTLPGGGRTQQLSAEEKLIQGYFLMLYGLMERVYILYDKGWIDGNTWQEWETWLAFLAEHPLFAQVHAVSQGMFNQSYQEHVSSLMSKPGSRPRP